MYDEKPAPIGDLYQVGGEAELVNGEIVLMPPTGGEAGSADGLPCL
jgi:Uma2 family endonuclease